MNQRIIAPRNNQVPAFFRKTTPRSHMCNTDSRSVGTLYIGSSIMKGSGSPLKKVFRSNQAVKIATASPSMYIENMTDPSKPGKNAAANRTYTGSLAPHEMYGLLRMDIIRSFSPSMLRQAIMAGMLQPNPSIMGMNVFPCTPSFRKSLSMTKAARAK